MRVEGFSDYAKAEAFVRSSDLAISACLATNNWIAIPPRADLQEAGGKSHGQSAQGTGSHPG